MYVTLILFGITLLISIVSIVVAVRSVMNTSGFEKRLNSLETSMFTIKKQMALMMRKASSVNQEDES
jgi:uncharacterized protein YoxC